MAEISDSKTVIIIDDIYYSREMEEAWEEIKSYMRMYLLLLISSEWVLFFSGRGITKNDYIIRY